MNPPQSEPTVQQLFDLTGKTALITGGSGHLGGAFSRALAEAGASVIISSRDTQRARQVAAKLPTPGSAAHHGIALDYMQPDLLDRGFTQAAACAQGNIDILVNNGLDEMGKDLTNCTQQEFAHHQMNNAGYFALARHVRDLAVEKHRPASIIMIGSMFGQVGSYPDAYEGARIASPVAYHALKGGTIHMTRHLAVYWAKDNVRVNCLSPGMFPPATSNTTMIERLRTKLPMKRMGIAYELKGVLLLLASDAGSYFTGQNITIDGGWTAW